MKKGKTLRVSLNLEDEIKKFFLFSPQKINK